MENQRKLVKLSISVLLVLCMFFSLSMYSVEASSILDEKQLTEEETDKDSSEDTNTPRTRSNYLNLGNIQIKRLASNECYVMGLTQAYKDCDMLYLDLVLEQKNNGSYSTYKTWSFTAANSSSLSRSINVLVPKNHYYRVKGYHAAKEGGIKESTTTQTKGVWIGD